MHSDPAEIARIAARPAQRSNSAATSTWAGTSPRRSPKCPRFAREGIGSFEQPLPADDLEGAARLVSETGLDVMADESLNTRASLERLIEMQACTAINARISKCGGLIATLARCREATRGRASGSRSAARSASRRFYPPPTSTSAPSFREMRHAEGCFGKLLLSEDPATPAAPNARRRTSSAPSGRHPASAWTSTRKSSPNTGSATGIRHPDRHEPARQTSRSKSNAASTSDACSVRAAWAAWSMASRRPRPIPRREDSSSRNSLEDSEVSQPLRGGGLHHGVDRPPRRAARLRHRHRCGTAALLCDEESRGQDPDRSSSSGSARSSSPVSRAETGFSESCWMSARRIGLGP